MAGLKFEPLPLTDHSVVKTRILTLPYELTSSFVEFFFSQL